MSIGPRAPPPPPPDISSGLIQCSFLKNSQAVPNSFLREGKERVGCDLRHVLRSEDFWGRFLGRLRSDPARSLLYSKSELKLLKNRLLRCADPSRMEEVLQVIEMMTTLEGGRGNIWTGRSPRFSGQVINSFGRVWQTFSEKTYGYIFSPDAQTPHIRTVVHLASAIESLTQQGLLHNYFLKRVISKQKRQFKLAKKAYKKVSQFLMMQYNFPKEAILKRKTRRKYRSI